MRRIEDDFCAVCADAVAQAIERKVKRRTAPARPRRAAGTSGYPPARAPLAARPLKLD